MARIASDLSARDGDVSREICLAMEERNRQLCGQVQHITDAWDGDEPGESSDGVPFDGLDPDDAIGYLEIPAIDVTLPLYLGASEDHLAKGAAVLSETSLPVGGVDTNAVIAAHAGWYGSPYFHHIDDLLYGDRVLVTNPRETLAYQVVGYTVVGPEDTDAVRIQEGRDLVTLVTCYPYRIGGGPDRYLVYCERVLSEEGRDAPRSEPEAGTLLPGTTDVPAADLKAHVSRSGLSLWEERLRYGLPAAAFLLIGVRVCLACRRRNKEKECE